MSEINSIRLLSATSASAAVGGGSAPVSAMLPQIARAATMIDGALGTSVKGLSEMLVEALGRARDRVGSAQLEFAMLDFAREAKALAIGNPDAAGDDIGMIVDKAIDSGTASLGALPDVGLTPIDRATAFFAAAAHTVSVARSAPLYDPGVC